MSTLYMTLVQYVQKLSMTVLIQPTMSLTWLRGLTAINQLCQGMSSRLFKNGLSLNDGFGHLCCHFFVADFGHLLWSVNLSRLSHFLYWKCRIFYGHFCEIILGTEIDLVTLLEIGPTKNLRFRNFSLKYILRGWRNFFDISNDWITQYTLGHGSTKLGQLVIVNSFPTFPCMYGFVISI